MRVQNMFTGLAGCRVTLFKRVDFDVQDWKDRDIDVRRDFILSAQAKHRLGTPPQVNVA